MEGKVNSPEAERSVPVHFLRGSRAFKQFKNPPQPHMCIQDTIKNTTEKLYINVLGWQKIANTQQNTDPIPLYGGMQISRCGPKNTKSPSTVFAVMVNPEILKVNGKNAENPSERDALVNLLCDFVEAKNPGLELSHNPIILKDRDLAGELKDVWLAVTERREREKYSSQEITHKIYHIDIPPEQFSNDSSTVDIKRTHSNNHQNDNKAEPTYRNGAMIVSSTSTTQCLRNTGQKLNVSTDKCHSSAFVHNSSHLQNSTQYCKNQNFDMNKFSGYDCDLNPDFTLGQSTNFTSTQSYDQRSNGQTSTVCTPVYGQIMSTRENYLQVGENHLFTENQQDEQTRMNYIETTIMDSVSDWETGPSNRNSNANHNSKSENGVTNTTMPPLRCDSAGNKIEQYNFFPVFDSNMLATSHTSLSKVSNSSENFERSADEIRKDANTDNLKSEENPKTSHLNVDLTVRNSDKSVVILDTMQKLALNHVIKTAAGNTKGAAK